MVCECRSSFFESFISTLLASHNLSALAVSHLGPFESCELSIMVSSNSSVVGCGSSQYRLNKQEKVLYAEHPGMVHEE